MVETIPVMWFHSSFRDAGEGKQIHFNLETVLLREKLLISPGIMCGSLHLVSRGFN